MLGAVCGVTFLAISLWSYRIDNAWLSFEMGLIACTAFFMLLSDYKEVSFLNWFAKYTMPVFLMHTLFAAPCRVLLMKFGITNAPIQIGIGIAVSYLGPIVAMMILERIKLDFLVYPGKLIRKGKCNENSIGQ